jgi:hypothetical protein
MSYSLAPEEVKKVMQARLTSQPYNKAQFEYYHLHRNYFNVKDEVTTLERIGGRKYRDNRGNIWEEQPRLKNFFHMPKGNWLGSLLHLTKPYSRKFLRNDTTSGLGGEFEMIIRHDGKRIDAFVHESYQETYNFAPTRNFKAHKLLDVDTHRSNSRYTFKMDMGRVDILE